MASIVQFIPEVYGTNVNTTLHVSDLQRWSHGDRQPGNFSKLPCPWYPCCALQFECCSVNYVMFIVGEGSFCGTTADNYYYRLVTSSFHIEMYTHFVC